MSFKINNWACISGSLNQGQETITPFGGSPTLENAPNIFMYGNTSDSVATISAANYFLSMYASLSVGDWILGTGSDASFSLIVTASSSTSVTVASTGLTTNVGTANIVNNAVTYAKMQQVAADSLVGNPTGGLANAQGITLGNGLEFTGTVLDIPNTNLIYAAVPVSAAEFNGMYGAPKLLVAAPGANKLILVSQLALAMTFVSADYAAGGVVAAQYDSTVHGGGVLATATETAADFFAAASTVFRLTASLAIAPFATTVNKGLYLSNATQAFTTGDSTFVAHIWYRIIPTV